MASKILDGLKESLAHARGETFFVAQYLFDKGKCTRTVETIVADEAAGRDLLRTIRKRIEEADENTLVGLYGPGRRVIHIPKDAPR